MTRRVPSRHLALAAAVALAVGAGIIILFAASGNDGVADRTALSSGTFAMAGEALCEAAAVGWVAGRPSGGR